MTPNEGQSIAVNGIIREMIESDNYGAALIGEGGTGKTFCTTLILKQLIHYELTVLLTAPTNKAVKQMEKACRAAGLPMDQLLFKTIHSALGLALMPSSERKHVSQTGEQIVSQVDVVVLDESSMLNSILLDRYLLPVLHGGSVFCLFLGDNLQLPPVGETRSKAFDLFKAWELTKNERQRPNPDGSPNMVNVAARDLRQAILEGKPYTFDYPEGQNLELLRAGDFIPAIVDFFDHDTDLEENRVIAWRNSRVDQINQAVRKKLWGADAWKFVVGERVVTAQPLKVGEKVLSTDEECIVKQIRPSRVFDENTESYWDTACLVLEPVYADIQQAFAHIVADHEMERYNRRLEELERKAREAKNTAAHGLRWRMFHQFKELFASITYCYCITAHRAQGSSYTRVFLDVTDMLDCPRAEERKKLIYVGMSRTRMKMSMNRLRFTT